MKYVYVILFTQFMFRVKCGPKNYGFFPNLPSGEYKVFFKAFMPCEVSNHLIQMNLYLSKKSINVTELRGNLTYKIPMDDTLDVNFNMAVKDSIGGWKDNAVIYKSPKLCSTMKNFMGSEWANYYEHFEINNVKCPIAAGVYHSKGYDLTNFISKTNFPKVMFYGTYRLRLTMTNKKNEPVSCCIIVLDIKRPWETE